jgi:hypothetical protein
MPFTSTKEDAMTAATVEKKFGRTVEQALAKYTVRAKAFANVVAAMKDSDAEAGSPEFNSLAAERVKAERYLKTATQSLTKKGWTFESFGSDPIPPEAKPEEPKSDKPAKAAKPKRPSFASTLPAREKLAAKCGPNVAALLLSIDPVKLTHAEAAIAADLMAAETEPTRDAIIYVGQPMFLSHGLILGVSSPAKQQLPNPRWAGKQTIVRIARQVKDAAPKKDGVDTAIADVEGDQGRPLTDSEAMEVAADVAKTEAA